MSSGVTYNIGELEGGGSSVLVNGVRIEISSDVHAQFPIASLIDIQAIDGRPIASNSPDETLIVDERVLELREGRLHWGGEDYGVVSAESQIRIDTAGMHIDGRLVEPAGR